jgi:hypothetical protein
VRKEALLWNNRLGMQRGVRVAGIGVDLLNDQTTKRDSIGSLECVGEGLFTSKTLGYGTASPNYLDHVPKIFREPIRCFHDLLS